MTRLAIVIVSFNAWPDLERCLSSLHEAPPAIPHEIVVVDNASTDESPARLRGRFPAVRLIVLDENVGFAHANNIAIRASAGDLVLLLNGDTIVPAGAIDRLVQALEADPGAAVAGPRLVDASGAPELSFGRMVGPFTEPLQKRLVRGIERELPWALREVARRTGRRGYPDWVSGACLLARRAALESAGLLDERYFMYLEDVDLCAAIRARGHRILFVPEVTITHLRGRSRQSAPAATQRAYRRSHLAFYEKHHPGWAPLLRLYLRLKGEGV